VTGVAHLERARIDDAAVVLARAFHPDPGMVFIFAEDRRLDRSEAFFRVMVRAVSQAGVAVATPGLESIGLLVPPSAQTAEAVGAAGMADFMASLLPAEAERFGRLVSTLGGEHDRVMTEPHWQLAFLGTEPSAQGRGFGVAVVDDVVARADRDGVPAFLDTLTSENAAFYGRHGFTAVSELDIPDSDVHAWAMRHEPSVS
jgi:ribosomal protein S18 acetylase RimI-like enzyme